MHFLRLILLSYSAQCQSLASKSELAERLKGSGLTINALHPGRVKTDIGFKNSGLLYKIGWSIVKLFLSVSVEKGVETSIYNYIQKK